MQQQQEDLRQNIQKAKTDKVRQNAPWKNDNNPPPPPQISEKRQGERSSKPPTPPPAKEEENKAHPTRQGLTGWIGFV